MKKAKIAELKNHLSRYLDHVRSGESVLVLDRDQPVAQIIPLARPTEGSRRHDARRLLGAKRQILAAWPRWSGVTAVEVVRRHAEREEFRARGAS